jgi:hypothetical protein
MSHIGYKIHLLLGIEQSIQLMIYFSKVFVFIKIDYQCKGLISLGKSISGIYSFL